MANIAILKDKALGDCQDCSVFKDTYWSLRETMPAVKYPGWAAQNYLKLWLQVQDTVL